jgi:DNA-binding LacI/PurR family transcriptional regulator
VSRTTVSYILNNRPDVSFPPETRDRVLRAAEELGYRPNRLAQSLKRGRTQTIGVLVYRLDTQFTAGLVDGLQDFLSDQQYGALVACSRYDYQVEAAAAFTMLEHQVDALICAPTEPIEPSLATWMKEVSRHIPVCLLTNRVETDLPVDFVIWDGFAEGKLAAEHMATLGHKRIAHIRGYIKASGNQARVAGFRAGLAACDVEVDEALIVGDSFEGQGTDQALDELLALPNPPTAIVAANDYIAAEALHHLRAKGKRVPEDIALLGMGDVELASYLGLTTVREHPTEIGRRAAEFVLSRLDEPSLASRAAKQEGSLVIRETCGASQRK